MQGWIKLHRELIEKPIWSDSSPEQKTILITLLILANHKGKEWEWKGSKFKAEPGQFITSLESLAKKCGKGVSVQNVRTALKRFEKYEFITNESTNKNRLITLVNWEVYQNKDDDLTNKVTSNQQAVNKQLTTTKNDKECKKKHIDEIKEFRSSYSSDIQDLIDQYWNEIKKTRKTGKISYSVIAKTMKKWTKYDPVVVHYSIKKHIEAYADGERDEKYTLGIMRNTSRDEAEDLLQKKKPSLKFEQSEPANHLQELDTQNLFAEEG